MNLKPTCDLCQRTVEIDKGEGYYECIKCGQEVCSDCSHNAPEDSSSVICDECWPVKAGNL